MVSLSSFPENMTPAEKRAFLARLLGKKAEKKRVFPLSFAQQRLWFLHQLDPASSIYTMSTTAKISGFLHFQVLDQVLREIVQRHESLRTTFISRTGNPMQVINPEARINLALADLQSVIEDERLPNALRLASAETNQPFDLVSGPLLRVFLIRLSRDTCILTLNIHHIISDDWSLSILIHEISVLYEAFGQGKSSPLAPLSFQYADFSVWQRNWLQGSVLQDHLDYWKKQLRGAVPLELPTDHPRPALRSHRGAAYSFVFSAELSEALAALSRHHEATLFMTLLTAFQILLYRVAGQTDIVVGTDVANRTHTETETLIGFFVNLLALRTNLSGNPAFQNLLLQVRKMVLEAYTYQNLPFEMLVENLRLERNLNQTPLLQVIFVLQNAPASSRSVPGLGLEIIRKSTITAKFDLALFMRESPDCLKGQVIYSTDLFEEHTIATMMSQFETLLQGIVARPTTSIDLLDLYTQSEKAERANKKLEKRKSNFQSLLKKSDKKVDK